MYKCKAEGHNETRLNIKHLIEEHNNDKKINGGFYEEFHKSVFGWKKTLKVNSWASMFSLQALYWLENFSTIDLNEEYELLY